MSEQLTRTETRDGRGVSPVCPDCRRAYRLDVPWAVRRTYTGVDVILLFKERTLMTCENCGHTWMVVVTAQRAIHNE